MPSNASYFKLVNNTTTDIVNTEVSGIDDYDWDNSNRPDNNFHGVRINAGEFRREREELNYWASHCPFTLKLFFADNSVEKFTINQKFAIGKGPDGFVREEGGTHTIDYHREGSEDLVVTISKPV